MSRWVETKDGKIVDVYTETETFAAGREVLMNEPKLKYGEEIVIDKKDIKEIEGTEDDLATIFKRMDEEVEEFMGQITRVVKHVHM